MKAQTFSVLLIIITPMLTKYLLYEHTDKQSEDATLFGTIVCIYL